MKEECEVSHHEHLGELIRRREQLEAIAGEENARSRARAEEFYDRKSHSRPTKAGGWVMIRHETREEALDLHFEGPFRVIQKIGSNVKIISPRFQDGKWVHLNRCKPWGNREIISLTYREPVDNGMAIAPETDEESLENVKGDSPVNVENNEEDSPVVSDLVMDPKSDYGGSRGSSRMLAEEPGGSVDLRRSARIRKKPDWFGYSDSD